MNNNCDKCNMIDESLNLIWIDSEDFKPLKKDNFCLIKYKEAIKKYSALCEECYIRECLK